jgi:hypothetical protein
MTNADADAPIVVRFYEPVALSFPPGLLASSLDATVPLPRCFLCEGHTSPPGRMGWLSAGGDRKPTVGRRNEVCTQEEEMKSVLERSSVDCLHDPNNIK